MRDRLAIALGLVVATLAVYGQVRHHEFVDHDDLLYIVDNPWLAAGLSLDSVIAAFTTPQLGNWIPLTWISLQVDHALYGLEPAGYLLTNAALHALASVVLFLALARMTRATGPSAFVAAVFALHPLHVESVAWATERKDTLSGLFWMLTLWAWARYAEAPSLRRYAPALAFFGLGLLSKPIVVTLPFALLLLDYWPLGRLREDGGSGLPEPRAVRRAVAEKIPMLAGVAAASVATFAIQRAAGAMSAGGSPLPLAMRISNALESWLVYLKMAVWPTGLAAFYPHPLERATPARAVVAAVVLLAITALALRWTRRLPYLAVGWLWYVGTLVPVIGIVQVGMQARADRYMYLPLVGLAIALAWGGRDLAATSSALRRAVPVAAALALAAMAATSWLQVRHWRDTTALFERAVAVVEGNFLGHQRLAIHLARAGRIEEARRHYEESIRIEPRRAAPHLELAGLLARQGELQAAIDRYARGLDLAPDHADGRRALGFTLAQAGRLREAHRELERAAELAPDSRDVHTALAGISQALGREREAIRHYREALRIDPAWTAGANNLAWILATTTDSGLRAPERAIALAEGALRSGARDPALLDTLAAAYAAAGRFDEALATAERGISLARERGDATLAAELARHLESYRRGEPLRIASAAAAD